MRRFIPGGTWAYRALIVVLALAQIQADAAPLRKKKKSEPPPPKVEETVGDLAMVLQGSEIKVVGIGLVSGLDNTGSDPGPSWYRKQLVDEMQKAGVDHANRILADSRYSMVLVRMTVFTGSAPQDRFDVNIELPPGSGTTSLAGGYLMATGLREVMVAGGSPRTGTELAIAQGPVMIGNSNKPNDPKVGRVLGGGRVKKEYPYMLVIKEKRRSVHTAAILAEVVNSRFHQSSSAKQVGAATAKTDGYLVLKVPGVYHQNQDRFFRVVQLLPMVDTPALRAQRVATWGKELLAPSTSGVAALKLEGLGLTAAEILRTGLKSPHPQVRFFAAESLAYLDDPSGCGVLAETVINLPTFRAYALAALASSDQSACHVRLRQLMDQPDVMVRYGAFNALRTLDPHDPALGHVRVLDEPKTESDESEESPDSMALALARSARKSHAEDPFDLYLVDSEGPPVVHVSRTRRSEIVVFGRGQHLLPPIVLGTGSILLNAADRDEKIEICKIEPSKFGDNDVKLRTSMELGEVIKRVANLGATYPDVVAILDAANRQRNLPGSLVVDAVPIADTKYLESAILGRDATAKIDSSVKHTTERRPSRILRFFGLGNRESNDTMANRDVKPRPAGGSEPAPAPTKDGSAPSSATAVTATSSSDASLSSNPKIDPALQRAGGQPAISASSAGPAPSSPSSASSSSSRPRLLDWLFRRSD